MILVKRNIRKYIDALERCLSVAYVAVWKLSGKTVYKVIGDSHASVFNYYNRNYISGIKFDVCAVKGATIAGINNPNSITDSKRIFETKFKKYDRQDKVIVVLGEVDCGFLIWHQVEVVGLPMDIVFKKVLTKYQEFITRYSKKVDLVIVSAPLPTILDGETHGNIANLRSKIKASRKQKTDLTIEFNKAISDYCVKLDVTFIDLDLICYDNNTGYLNQKFINKCSGDHHYNSSQYIKVLLEALKLDYLHD